MPRRTPGRVRVLRGMQDQIANKFFSFYASLDAQQRAAAMEFVALITKAPKVDAPSQADAIRETYQALTNDPLAPTFKPGDVVCLKSGGDAMTIVRENAHTEFFFDVVYFDGEGMIAEAAVAAVALDLYTEK